jgi:hypothetical protein
MRTKNVYKGSLNTMVKIIDWTEINKAISKSVGEDVECRIGTGIIQDVEAIFEKGHEQEIKSIIVDKECCGVSTTKNNYYSSELNDGDCFCLNAFDRVDFYKVDKITENGRSISMFPSYSFNIDIDDINNCLTGEEKSLFDFMGSRYSYNSRIDSNEMNILRLVYHKQKQEGNVEWLEKEIKEVED